MCVVACVCVVCVCVCVCVCGMRVCVSRAASCLPCARYDGTSGDWGDAIPSSTPHVFLPNRFDVQVPDIHIGIIVHGDYGDQTINYVIRVRLR